jgi:glycosyltransferase involved in cell wall biosynthesis
MPDLDKRRHIRSRSSTCPHVCSRLGRHPERGLRVALVHDYLQEMGGAERVVEALLAIFPEAPLYTSVYEPRVSSEVFTGRAIHTTFLQPVARRKAVTKALFPLLPAAFRRLDLGGYDVVLSSSSGFAHHVRTGPETLHVCYCHNPPRFLWQPQDYFRGAEYLSRVGHPLLERLRRLDLRAAAGVDAYVANSAVVAERIERTYGREATVIHPPVDVSRFRVTAERSERFLVVSRLLPYKRIDLAVEAATRLGLGLDVIGDGPERRRLERMAGPTVRFLGRRPNEEVEQAMARAIAVVVPGREDFGLTPVEAQAAGRPPVAYAGGGALETIADGETGFLFAEQTWEAAAEAMERARTTELDPARLRASAERFDVSAFERRLLRFVEERLARRRGQQAAGAV